MSVTNPYIASGAVYGPVNSRRLGKSLGINFFINKLCNYDCAYCYLGKTLRGAGKLIPSEQIIQELEEFLKTHRDMPIDYVTFCGNGEPTIHPEFPEVVNKTFKVIEKYRSSTPTALFSNATTLDRKEIMNVVKSIDKVFLKFDLVNEKHFYTINKPMDNISFQKIIDNLKLASAQNIRYTLDVAIITFLIKEYKKNDYEYIRNWLKIVKEISPPEVNLYTIIYHPDIIEEKYLKEKLNALKNDIDEIASFIKHNLENGGILCKIYI